MVVLYTLSYVKFSVLAKFLMKVFSCRFILHNAFHDGVRQRSQKLNFCAILYVYPRNKFMYKGLYIVQKTYL